MFEGSKLEETVKGWMVESGFYQDRIEDEAANFHLLAEYPERSGSTIDIINPKNRPDMILLVGSIEISPEHREGLRSLPPAKRREFLDNLMEKLIFQPVGFIANPSMDEPQNIQLVRELYREGITKQSFVEGLGWINRCITFIAWRYRNTFDQEKKNDAPGSMYQ
ncbi:MAG: hypothetical protein A4E32_00124 [Methanomassiliicoccales archaeon PtaU1.Bin124]|nr:MAG: hypothetical protein A4E32_00124 [Methanomassiliicoccales archaeon PtaU1.Bin124]